MPCYRIDHRLLLFYYFYMLTVLSSFHCMCYAFFEMKIEMKNELLFSCCYYHIRHLRQVSHCVWQDVMKQLASAFIPSRLDYCNSILARWPKSTIATLQRVQNSAARMVLNLRPRNSISCALTPDDDIDLELLIIIIIICYLINQLTIMKWAT